MRKVIFSLIMFLTISGSALLAGTNAAGSSSSEVAPIFREGDKVLSLGFGVGTTLYSRSFHTPRMVPVSLSFEYGVMDDFMIEDMTIGFGGYLGFSSSRLKAVNVDYQYYIVGGRAGLHYPVIENLDTYAGLMMGVNIINSSAPKQGNSDSKKDNDAGLISSLFLGGRYYFAEEFAVMGEIGYGVSYLTVGISFRF